MMHAVAGMVERIQAFIGRLFSPGTPESGDDLSFLDDLSWLSETESMRQDALLFWSESTLNRAKSLSAMAAPNRFYEKHTTALPQQGIAALDALAGTPADTSRPPLFERPASPSFAAGGTAAGMYEPVRTFVDPLEDLYEPVVPGAVPAWESTPRPYSDLYAVIMRLSANRKQQ